jgi:hypothetical protein
MIPQKKGAITMRSERYSHSIVPGGLEVIS